MSGACCVSRLRASLFIQQGTTTPCAIIVLLNFVLGAVRCGWHRCELVAGSTRAALLLCARLAAVSQAGALGAAAGRGGHDKRAALLFSF